MLHRRTTFTCCPTAYSPAELDALGVRVEAPLGPIAYRLAGGELVAEVGQIVVVGDLIHVIPREGIDDRHRALLAGAVTDAWVHPPAVGVAGWDRVVADGVEFWSTWVSVPAGAISADSVSAATAVQSGRPGAPTG